MASPLDKKVIFGLLYLWIKDGKLALTLETEQYINEHCQSLLNSKETNYSDEEIVAFIEERRLVPRVVHRLRQASPKARLTRYQRNLIYGRPRPRARVTPLSTDSGVKVLDRAR